MNTTRVGVKALRRNLKKFIEGYEAIAIGDYYHVRAILVPVPPAGYGDNEKQKALRVAKQKFNALLKRESPRSGSLLRG